MPQTLISGRSVPMKLALPGIVFVVFATLLYPQLSAQSRAQNSADKASQPSFGEQISGMYTFLRDGEFVQVTVEEGKLTGFVSRYGERESDKDAFLDQFFSKGSLEGKKISFTTKAVHGTWFEFAGEIRRGDAKTPDAEGYWVIRGTLKQFDEDEANHVSAKSREVTFKSFPQDVEGSTQPK